MDKELGVELVLGRSGIGYRLQQIGRERIKYTDHVWSYNETSLGSGDRHLCDNLGKCVTSKKTNVLENNGTLNWEQMGWAHLKLLNYSDVEDQRFYFIDSLTYPGFYVIKDEFGKCISVPEKMDRDGAEIWATNCNASEAGQLWQWYYLDSKSKDRFFFQCYILNDLFLFADILLQKTSNLESSAHLILTTAELS